MRSSCLASTLVRGGLWRGALSLVKKRLAEWGDHLGNLEKRIKTPCKNHLVPKEMLLADRKGLLPRHSSFSASALSAYRLGPDHSKVASIDGGRCVQRGRPSRRSVHARQMSSQRRCDAERVSVLEVVRGVPIIRDPDNSRPLIRFLSAGRVVAFPQTPFAHRSSRYTRNVGSH